MHFNNDGTTGSETNSAFQATAGTVDLLSSLNPAMAPLAFQTSFFATGTALGVLVNDIQKGSADGWTTEDKLGVVGDALQITGDLTTSVGALATMAGVLGVGLVAEAAGVGITGIGLCLNPSAAFAGAVTNFANDPIKAVQNLLSSAFTQIQSTENAITTWASTQGNVVGSDWSSIKASFMQGESGVNSVLNDITSGNTASLTTDSNAAYNSFNATPNNFAGIASVENMGTATITANLNASAVSVTSNNSSLPTVNGSFQYNSSTNSISTSGNSSNSGNTLQDNVSLNANAVTSTSTDYTSTGAVQYTETDTTTNGTQTANITGTGDNTTLNNATITLSNNSTATVYGDNNAITVGTGSQAIDDLSNGNSDVYIAQVSAAVGSEMEHFTGANGTGTNDYNLLNLNAGYAVTVTSGSYTASYSYVWQQLANLSSGVSKENQYYSGPAGTGNEGAVTDAISDGSNRYQITDKTALTNALLTFESYQFNAQGQITVASTTSTNGTQDNTVFNRSSANGTWSSMDEKTNAAGQITQVTQYMTDGNYYQSSYNPSGTEQSTTEYNNSGVYIQQVYNGGTYSDSNSSGAYISQVYDDSWQGAFDFTNSGVLSTLNISDGTQSTIAQSSNLVTTKVAQVALAQASAISNTHTAGNQPVFEGGKWSGNVITWSLATSNNTNAPFSNYMSSAYQAMVQKAFADWGSVSGLTFQQVTDSSASDIRLGWGNFNTQTSGILGYTFYQNVAGTLQSGEIVRLEDPTQDALTGTGNSATYSGTQATLSQALLHEIGHAIGFADDADPNSVMYYQSTTSNPDVNITDAIGVHALYSNMVNHYNFSGAGQTLAGSGYAAYGYNKGDGADVIQNGTPANNIPTGELGLGGIPASDLSFIRSGNNLIAGSISSPANNVTIQGWFANPYAQLSTIFSGESLRYINDGTGNIIFNNYTNNTSQIITFPSTTGSLVSNYSGLEGMGNLTSYITNNADGTSLQVILGTPGSNFINQLNYFTTANATGTLTQTIFNWVGGGSQLHQFTNLPVSNIHDMFINYSGVNGTGTIISDIRNYAPNVVNAQDNSIQGIYVGNPAGVAQVFNFYTGLNATGSITRTTDNNSDGTSVQTIYNPSSAVSNQVNYFTSANTTGTLTRSTFNWVAGGSQLQWYNPSAAITIQYQNFSGANGTGTHTYDLVNWSAGGSQYQWFNPSAAIAVQYQNYSGANGTGTYNSQVTNWTAGGSQWQIFSGNPAGTSQEVINYTGAGCTGTVTSHLLYGTAGNDTLTPSAVNETLVGGGGYDTYQFAKGNGQDVIQNGVASTNAANGELDIAAGVATNQLWFAKSGNDLLIEIMGGTDHLLVAGYYSNNYSQLKEIKTADGSMIDSQLPNLVQIMAEYSSANSAFNPATATQIPNDPTLQTTLAAAWHH